MFAALPCAGEPLPDETDAPEPADASDPPELVRAREALAQYAAEEGVEEPLELTHTRAALAAAGRLNGGGGGGADALGGASVRDAAADAELDQLEAAGRAAWAARQEGDPDWLPMDDTSGGDGTKPPPAAAAPQPPPAQQPARPPPRAGASLSPDDDDGVAVAAPRPYAGTAAAAQQAALPEAAAPRRRVVIEEIESDSDDESVDSASETEETGATLIAQSQLIAPPHGSLADID